MPRAGETGLRSPAQKAQGNEVVEGRAEQTKKWKTPFERALERVRSPQKKPPASSIYGGSIRASKNWSRDISDSDDDAFAPTRAQRHGACKDVQKEEEQAHVQVIYVICACLLTFTFHICTFDDLARD